MNIFLLLTGVLPVPPVGKPTYVHRLANAGEDDDEIVPPEQQACCVVCNLYFKRRVLRQKFCSPLCKNAFFRRKYHMNKAA